VKSQLPTRPHDVASVDRFWKLDGDVDDRLRKVRGEIG